MLTVPPDAVYLGWNTYEGPFPATNRVNTTEQVGRSPSGLTAARASAVFYRNPATPTPAPNDVYGCTESAVRVEIVSFITDTKTSASILLQNPRAYRGTQDIDGDFDLVFTVHNHPRAALSIYGLSVHDDKITVVYGCEFGAMSSDDRHRFVGAATPFERWRTPTDIYQHDMSSFNGRVFFAVMKNEGVATGAYPTVTPPTEEEAIELLRQRYGWCHPIVATLTRDVNGEWVVEDETPLSLRPAPYYTFLASSWERTNLTDYYKTRSLMCRNDAGLEVYGKLRSLSGVVFDTAVGPVTVWLSGRCDWVDGPLDPAYPLIEPEDSDYPGLMWDDDVQLRVCRPASMDNLSVVLMNERMESIRSPQNVGRAEWDGPAFVTCPVQLDQPVYRDGKAYIMVRRIRQRRGGDAGTTYVAVISPPQYNEYNELIAEADIDLWPVGIPPERVGRLVIAHGVLTFTAYLDNKLWIMGIDGTLTDNTVRRLLEVKGADSALYLYKLILANGGSLGSGPSYGTVPMFHLEAAPAIHTE